MEKRRKRTQKDFGRGLREASTPINQGHDESFLSNWEEQSREKEEEEEEAEEGEKKIKQQKIKIHTH